MNPHARHLRALTLATAVMITAGLALSFFYAPQDAERATSRRSSTSTCRWRSSRWCGYVLGGGFGVVYLRTGERIWDMRSYCAIHMSLIFSSAGSSPARSGRRRAWGHWWVWSEPTLVSYLIVILLFCTYQPMRFSIEDPERQARYAAVFAIVGGAFVPLNFLAVRLSTAYVHPRVLNLEGGSLPGSMKVAFYTLLLGIALLFATLMKYEMLAKETRIETRRLRRRLLGDDECVPLRKECRPVMTVLVREAPALPLHAAGQVRRGAYIVVFAGDPDLRVDHGRAAAPQPARARRAARDGRGAHA